MRFITCYILLITFMAGACRKKDLSGPDLSDPVQQVNKWVYDSMRLYYYWSSSLPARPDYTLQTVNFFQSLLHTSDRFSVISNRKDIGPEKQSFQLYGFHYALVQHSQQAGLLGMVLYVAKESPAYRVGLRRGTFFTRINNTLIEKANYQLLQQAMQADLSFTLTPAVYSNGTFQEQAVINCPQGYVSENAVISTRLFSSNGIKTGYLFYNAFQENYDGTLLQAVQKLQQAGAGECIIDLRYNPGGSVASAAKLAGMLAALQPASSFAIFEGNRYAGKQTYSWQQLVQLSGSSPGKNLAELEARRLSLHRLFVLTSRTTASAAEMLINNLRPYMQVIQIGDTTTGKDEASFRIEDTRTPRQVAWVLQPTIYKLFNKNGEGRYDKGLIPAYTINELNQLPLAEIGSGADPLIIQALHIIYGTGITPAEATLRTSIAAPAAIVFNSFQQAAAPVLLPVRHW